MLLVTVSAHSSLALFFLWCLCDGPNFCFFFFNDTATTEIYTLSLHDALPISAAFTETGIVHAPLVAHGLAAAHAIERGRSEEHTSELQSQSNLVCRLLLEKKKKIKTDSYS